MKMRSSKPALLFGVLLLGALALHALAGPGGWDQTYAPTVTGAVNAMALQPDGKLLFGGTFTAVNSSSSRARLARLFADGSLDTTFFSTGSGVSSTVWCLAVQTDGRIVIGGDFTSVNGATRTRVARLNSNGTADGSFVPTNTIAGSVLALAAQTDNKIIIGGSFSATTFPKWNARLNADGTTDTAFSSFPNGTVNAIAIQSDGKIVIGGAFTTVNGAARNRIARLNADGSLDNTFQNGLTGASGLVRCVQIQPDGKILVGGDFAAVNGTARGSVARLNANGTLDTGFASSPGATGPVYAIAVQPDNNVLIAGGFSAYASSPLSRVARLYADGTADTSFSTVGINNLVQTLAVQSDGALLIGGTFTTNRSYLGRLYGNLYPPEFGNQPVSRATNVGATVTFSAAVNNPTPSTFQWRKDGNNILGATGTSYTLYNVQFADAGNYSVFVINGAGGTTSSNAVLNVGLAPAITGQPTSLTVTQGQSASFSVTATGTPLNYFWKKNGTFITGATNSAYSIASVADANAATYTCQVSNFLGSVTSTGAKLTVYSPPFITVQPVSQTVGVGSNFTVSVTATGNPAPTCQWVKDGTNIPGGTESIYEETSAKIKDAGSYSVILSNIFGVVTSSVANITVLYYAPSITAQPVGQTLLVGSNFTLTVTATGTAPLDYQWRKDGDNLPGANGTSYAVTSAQTNDTGVYTVVVTNLAASSTSAVAQVNVGYAPLIIQQPQPFTNSLGTSNAFTVIVSGSEPLIYQWFKDGMTIANATNNLLPLSNLQSNQVGYYSVSVNNLYGSTASSNALLTIPGVPFHPWLWQGLVAYYPFNGNAKDESGNGLDCVATNVAPAMDRFGNVGASFHFNGTNSVVMRVEPGFDIGWEQYSLCLWMATDGNKQYQTLFNTVPHAGIDVVYNHPPNPNVITSSIGPGRGGWVNQLDPGTKNDYVFLKWYQVVLVKSGTHYSCYVDARLDNTYEVPSATGFGCSSGWNIGKIGDTIDESGQVFLGRLDDVRIYNRALSSNEVAQLYAVEADMPVISTQPQNQTVAQGGMATLSVTASAVNSLTYQWFKDGMALTGFTNTTLTLTNVQPGQIGFYSVAVSNAVTGVVSANAALSVSGQDFALWQGLVAYYPFNGNANDESGHGNNGTAVNTTLTTDRFGNLNMAYHFNGIDSPAQSSLVSVTNNVFNIGTNYTIALWFSTDDISKYRQTLFNTIPHNGTYISFNHSECPSFLAYNLGPGNGFDVMLAHGIKTNWNANRWYYVAFIKQGNNYYLYVDQQLEHTTLLSAAYNLQVGIRVGGTAIGSEIFKGSLDDVRIYDRALSPTELAQLYAYEADMPVITRQPQTTIVTQGNPVSFGVAATAQNPLTYQWSRNGIPIATATNAMLFIPDVQPSQAGLYAVAISNRLTGMVSAQAALAVISSSGAGAPGFTNNQFGFGISGAAGNLFVIESSTNLIDWYPMATNTFGLGMFLFLDPASQTNIMGFYRVRLRGLPAPANMVWIPAGTFTMGSPETETDRDSDEGPQTQVTLTDYFWMGKYEVTQGEYLAVMSNNPSYFTGDSNRPVERVTWSNATNYCAKLTVREQAAGRLPVGYVYRLPTEAEWEYACRAGTITRFSWGDDPGYTLLGDYAWYGPNSGGVAAFITNPVGLKLPNPWGLYDMNGNVWEWCWDWGATSLPGGSVTNPVGPVSGASRILRGGWWSDPGGAICRSASRNGSGGTLSCFGFRVVLAKP